MPHVDEGLIHAWLDGQLPADEAARVERLVATDREWGDAAAEARGLIAGASRIASALDVGSGATAVAAAAASRAASVPAITRVGRRRSWTAIAMAASMVLVAGTAGLVWKSMGGVEIAPRQVPSAASDAAPVQTPALPHAAQAPAESKTAAPGSGGGGQRSQASQSEVRNEAIKKADQAPPKTGSGFGIGMGRGIPANDTTAKVLVAPPGAAGVASATNPVTNPATPPVVDQGALQQRAATARELGANLVAKATDEAALIDARLNGCWSPIAVLDTRRDRDVAEMAKRDSYSYVLRFIAPVLTDAQQRFAPSRSDAARAAQVLGAALPVPVQQATVRKLNDTTFNTEWIRNGARTLMTFSVRGDTLRGITTIPNAGPDSLARPFVATRTPCPPQ